MRTLGAHGAAAAPPHIMMILGDDVGWSDVGWHHDEINTPNMDAMVRAGVELDRMYAYHYCSPTRSSLLTGREPVNNNQINLGDLPVRIANMSGTIYREGADVRMTMLPKKLKAAGYVSYQIGKWHAGDYSFEQVPTARGFDHSFGYLTGGEDHFEQVLCTSGTAVCASCSHITSVGFQVHFYDNKSHANRTRNSTTCVGPYSTESCFYVDLWRDDGPAYGENGTCVEWGPAPKYTCTDGRRGDGKFGGSSYNAFALTGEAVHRINGHDLTRPMFMRVHRESNPRVPDQGGAGRCAGISAY